MSTSSITLAFSELARRHSDSARELERAVQVAKREFERNGVIVSETHIERPATLGPEWVPILTAVLSTPAVLIGIRAIRDVLKSWLQEHATLSVTLKRDGMELTVNAKNIDSLAEREIAKSLGLAK